MKNILLCAVIALTLASCSKDGNGLGNFDYPLKTLVGEWRITAIDGSPYQGGSMTMWFHKDGKYYFGNYPSEEEMCSYRLAGKYIKCYFGKEEFVRYEVLQMNNSEATFRYEAEGAVVEMRLEKMSDDPGFATIIPHNLGFRNLSGFRYKNEVVLYGPENQYEYDGDDMMLLCGLRKGKLWIGIKMSDNASNALYEWTGGDPIPMSVTTDIPGSGTQTLPLKMMVASGVGRSGGKLAIVVNIDYDYTQGLITQKLMTDDNGTVRIKDLAPIGGPCFIRARDENSFVLYNNEYKYPGQEKIPARSCNYSFAGTEL